MAQTQTKTETATMGIKPKAAKRSFTWRFWVLVAAIIVAAISPWIPTLWGWQLGFLGTGFGDWSMAAHGGIMPGSIVYHQKQPAYSVGDIVSFEYKGNGDPTQNGPSLKLIVAKNSDGSYRVKGMNYVNSFALCDVKPEDIYGKVVCHHSYLPESYWRWLTMGWTLNHDEIDARWHAIFSFRTAVNVFTKSGRFRNWVEFTYPPTGVVNWSLDGRYIAVQNGDTVGIAKSPNRGQIMLHKMGTCLGWNKDGFLLVTPEPRLLAVSPTTGQETAVVAKPQSTSAAIVPSTSTSLGFEGWVDVKVDQKVVFPDRKGVAVRVVAVSRQRSGCSGGIATFVDVAPPLVPPPETMGERVDIR